MALIQESDTSYWIHRELFSRPIRATVRAFNQAEKKVLSEELYPTLDASLRQHLARDIDIIQSLKIKRDALESLGFPGHVMSAVIGEVVEDSPKTRIVRNWFYYQKPRNELLKQQTTLSEAYYLEIARALRAVALNHGIFPVDAARLQELRDEARKIIWPTRRGAEEDLEKTEQVGRQLDDVIYKSLSTTTLGEQDSEYPPPQVPSEETSQDTADIFSDPKIMIALYHTKEILNPRIRKGIEAAVRSAYRCVERQGPKLLEVKFQMLPREEIQKLEEALSEFRRKGLDRMYGQSNS